jgi:hypothetical protein
MPGNTLLQTSWTVCDIDAQLFEMRAGSLVKLKMGTKLERIFRSAFTSIVVARHQRFIDTTEDLSCDNINLCGRRASETSGMIKPYKLAERQAKMIQVFFAAAESLQH